MTSKTIATVLFGTASYIALAITGPAVAQERDQARANFLQADVNKDEKLDLAEFTTFINLNADHGLGRAATIRRFSQYARAFATADANKDGFVTRAEIAEQAKQ